MNKKISPVKQAVIQVFLFFVLLSVLFPIFWVIAISLDARDISRPLTIPFFDPAWYANISLDAYIKVLTSAKQGGNEVTFFRLLFNSLLVSGGTSLLVVCVGTTAAYSFSHFRFRGRQSGLFAFIVLQMIPPVGTLTPLYVLLNSVGLRNSHIGLMIAYASLGLPFAIWNMKGYMDTIPTSLQEAAMIDGCTPFQAFLRVVLPLAVPALAITGLFGFITGWTEFAMAWLLLENPGSFTLAMILRGLTRSGGAQRAVPWSQVMAFSMLLAIPVTALFLYLQKYIVSGLTLGGDKG